MEFDTKVKLKERGSVQATSEKEFDAFCESLWPILGPDAKNKADDGRGRFWLDYSTNLTTRYIVADVIEEGKASDDNFNYTVRIYSAKKPGYFADVILALLAIFTMWCISKISVPEPESIWIVGLVVAAGIGGLLAAIMSKPFGTIEAAATENAIKGFLNKK